MLGKYSPTVASKYSLHQEFWANYFQENECDHSGFDRYGYHRTDGRDRAGYTEFDYSAENGEEIYDQVRGEYQ